MGNIPEYKPFVGQTIEQAFDGAIQLAKKEKTTVVVVVNDIVMFANKKTNLKNAVDDYRDKVRLKYRAEQIKRTIQR